jgi:hypothetical protein
MNKGDVLQKVNDYCNEKSYTNETLTDDFKDKFSEFFAKRYTDDADINDESILNDLKFNLNTAFSATSKGITNKQKTFDEKENEYKRQLASLKQTLIKKDDDIDDDKNKFDIPQEWKDKFDELEQFKTEQKRQELFKEILKLAKKNVREDMHKSLESYAEDFSVSLELSGEEQAKKLTQRFQAIFKDTIGDTKPLAPKYNAKREEEILESLPKVKI